MDVLDKLVRAVRSTLGYWVYAVGVVAVINIAISGSLAVSWWWLPLLSSLILLSGGVVTWLQIARPGILQNWERRHADLFGRDLARVLGGHFTNLDAPQQAAAWRETIRVVAGPADDEDEAFAAFRARVAERLREVASDIEAPGAAGVPSLSDTPLGVIEPTSGPS